MAGHSKWANIKHRKARQDASRGKVWTKVIREITVAARGGPEPADNPRLRLALEKANAANIPKDTVKRAIQKGSGTGEIGAIEEITFEGYGPNGVAILVETITDNRNRTVSNVRSTFQKKPYDENVLFKVSRSKIIRLQDAPSKIKETQMC